MTTPIIDLHSHIIPPRLLETLRREGARYGVEITGSVEQPAFRVEGATVARAVPMPLTRIAERLEWLDQQGIDRQVMATFVDFSGYVMPADLGERFSELQNETIAEVVAQHPTRLMGTATVPLQDAARAVAVLERALAMGHRSVQIATYLGADRFLDDPAIFPFWEAAEALGVLIYFHPYDERTPASMRDYFMFNTTNYPLQTAIAIPRLIYGGVFQRFPGLKVCFPHGGGFLPYQLGRLRRAARLRPEPRSRGYTGDPLDDMKRFYFDTVTHDPASLRYLAAQVGADRLVMGSDYPFEMGDDTPVVSVKQALPDDPSLPHILGGTVVRLLGLEA